MMSLLRLLSACFVIGAIAAAALPEEESEGVEAGGALSFRTQYVSRGTVISGEPVLQPEIWLEYKGFTLDVWNNVDAADCNCATWRLIETDWAISYALSFHRVEMSAGYVYYTFPNLRAADTQEVYLSACFDAFLSPSLTTWYDFDEVCGTYTNASLTYSIPLGNGEKPAATVDLSAAVGWGDSSFIGGYFAEVGPALVDLTLSCEVLIRVSEKVSVTPNVAYMTVLDRDVRKCTSKSDTVYGGLSLVVEF